MNTPFILPPIIVVFDTEFTAWEGSLERNWSGSNEYREIVEIGAVRVDTREMSERDTFKTYVRPVKNPELSAYFTELTGISQEIVDREGVDYPTAILRFAEWCRDTPIYSWGNDGDVLRENCGLLGTPFPFEPSRFFDASDIFRKAGIPEEQYKSSTIIRAFVKEPIRRGHEALNDARTIMAALRELQAREVEIS